MTNTVETLIERVRDIWHTVLRRRWLVFATSAVAAVALSIGLSFFHDRYEATARVFVDTQTVLKPLMENLTFQPDIEQQVNMLARTVVSRPNVEKLAATPGLGFDSDDPRSRELIVTKLTKDIKVVPAGAGNLYDITYVGANPETARRLVAATVRLFVESGVGTKKRDSQEAGHFIDVQINEYAAKLTDAENRVKDFKVRNFGLTGVSSQDYFTRVSILTDEVSRLKVDLAAAEQTRASYRQQLLSENPQLPARLAADSARDGGFSPEARVEEQRRALDDLTRRYTDSHPDVVNARRVLAELEVQAARKAEEDRAARASGLSTGAATSPVYQKLRISLAEADAQVASLHSQLAAKQALLDQSRASAGHQPEAEAALAQLNRDYDIIRKNYDLMVARRESAALGMKLDESSQLAEFRVVEPPRVRASPLPPSRGLLAVLAVVVSLALGIAAAMMADLAWPTLDSRESLRLFSGRPVIGGISWLGSEAAVKQERVAMRRFAIAFSALFVAQLGWMIWNILRPVSFS